MSRAFGCFARRSNELFVILADQTPTPTRLLNNCEELRVFDDLQNINPFEEGFRRAVEDGGNGISGFLSTPSNQDTLHTPQILPQFESRPVKKEPPSQDEPENLTIPNTVDDACHIPKTSEVPTSTDLKLSQRPPIPLLPKSSLIYAAPIVSAPTTMLEASGRPSESVKDKLKNILLSNSGSQVDRKRIKTEPVPVPAIIIGSLPLLATPASLIINSNSNNIKLASNEMTQPETQKSESGSGTRKRPRSDRPEASNMKVERNRAAARRYR